MPCLVTHCSSVVSQAKDSVLCPSLMLLSIRPQYFLVQKQDYQNLVVSFQGRKTNSLTTLPWIDFGRHSHSHTRGHPSQASQDQCPQQCTLHILVLREIKINMHYLLLLCFFILTTNLEPELLQNLHDPQTEAKVQAVLLLHLHSPVSERLALLRSQ